MSLSNPATPAPAETGLSLSANSARHDVDLDPELGTIQLAFEAMKASRIWNQMLRVLYPKS